MRQILAFLFIRIFICKQINIFLRFINRRANKYAVKKHDKYIQAQTLSTTVCTENSVVSCLTVKRNYLAQLTSSLFNNNNDNKFLCIHIHICNQFLSTCECVTLRFWVVRTFCDLFSFTILSFFSPPRTSHSILISLIHTAKSEKSKQKC